MNILKRIFGIKGKESISCKTDFNSENVEFNNLAKFKSKNGQDRIRDIMKSSLDFIVRRT